jgi:hypothetical protein
MRTDVQRSEEEGFAFHFVKPVDPDVLAGLLRAYAVTIKDIEKATAC